MLKNINFSPGVSLLMQETFIHLFFKAVNGHKQAGSSTIYKTQLPLLAGVLPASSTARQLLI